MVTAPGLSMQGAFADNDTAKVAIGLNMLTSKAVALPDRRRVTSFRLMHSVHAAAFAAVDQLAATLGCLVDYT